MDVRTSGCARSRVKGYCLKALLHMMTRPCLNTATRAKCYNSSARCKEYKQSWLPLATPEGSDQEASPGETHQLRAHVSQSCLNCICSDGPVIEPYYSPQDNTYPIARHKHTSTYAPLSPCRANRPPAHVPRKLQGDPQLPLSLLAGVQQTLSTFVRC